MSSAFPYKTVVDTVATSKNLTIKATVKAEIGETTTTYDDQIDTNIRQASALIVGHCNREFASEKVTDSFRPGSMSCLETLWLSRVPVTTVHAVVEDGATLTSIDYEINANSGELWRLDSAGERTTWATGVLITVQHTGGYVSLTTLPHDVERACIDQVKAIFQGRQRDPTLRSVNMPDVFQASFALAGGDNFGPSGLLKSVEGALAPYRRWVVA